MVFFFRVAGCNLGASMKRHAFRKVLPPLCCVVAGREAVAPSRTELRVFTVGRRGSPLGLVFAVTVALLLWIQLYFLGRLGSLLFFLDLAGTTGTDQRGAEQQ
jgi:hypothetical protein